MVPLKFSKIGSKIGLKIGSYFEFFQYRQKQNKGPNLKHLKGTKTLSLWLKFLYALA